MEEIDPLSKFMLLLEVNNISISLAERNLVSQINQTLFPAKDIMVKTTARHSLINIKDLILHRIVPSQVSLEVLLEEYSFLLREESNSQAVMMLHHNHNRMDQYNLQHTRAHQIHQCLVVQVLLQQADQ